jgi:hypothetical protein
MKYLKWLLAFILTLEICSLAYIENDSHKKIHSCISGLDNIQRKIVGLPGQVEKISRSQTEESFIVELKALTRENEQLRMENLDLQTQLKEANSFWKGGER